MYIVIRLYQAFDYCQAVPEESEAVMTPLIMISVVRDILRYTILSVESLVSDYYRAGFTDLIDQIYYLRMTWDILDPGKGYFRGVYIIEPLYQAGIYCDIRVDGDDRPVRMLIDCQEFGGFDIGVHKEHRFWMNLLEIIELFEFNSSAIEVIIHGDSDYFIHDDIPSFIMFKSPSR
jgi:hypothetical protein